MNESNTPVEATPDTTYVVRFEGGFDVDGPLNAEIGTPVTFSGVGRVVGHSTREAFMARGPQRDVTEIAVESVSAISAVGGATVATKTEPPASPKRFARTRDVLAAAAFPTWLICQAALLILFVLAH